MSDSVDNNKQIDKDNQDFEDYFRSTYGEREDFSLSKKDRDARLVSYDIARSAFFAGIQSAKTVAK